MTAKDDALEILRSNQSVGISQTINAQWNHHLYTQPDAFGFYTGNSSPSTYYVSSSASASISVNSSTFTTASSVTGLATLNTENAVRVNFDARITGFPVTYDNIYTDYLIQITPYVSGTAQSELVDVKSIKLVENIYNKFEIIFISSKDATKFDRIDISVKSCATISSGSATLQFKNVSVSKVSENEIKELQAETLSEIFKPRRPGDQLLENGLLSTSGSASLISQYYITSDVIIDSNMDAANLMSAPTSPFNSFKYFIAPSGDSSTQFNVFSIYNTALPANEIYVKTQNVNISSLYDGKIASLTVYVKESGSWSSAFTTTSSAALQNGCLIIRWDGSSWNNSSITYPQINKDTGSISNTKSIEGIRVQITLSRNTVSEDQKLRARFIEVSPRLGLDLSNFLISSDFNMNIDEGNLPVPVGMASSNEGSVTLENLPRYISGNSGPVFQIFDNSSSNALRGLLAPEIKFTIYTSLSTLSGTVSTASIKTATMYATQWELDGIETVKVGLTDAGRYLQTLPCADILLTAMHTPNHIGNLQSAIEVMLQTSGFSDYDRTSLFAVSSNISDKRNGKLPVFFANNEKTVWEMLSELLLSWQISYFFDKNGVLKFKDLLRESKSITYSTTSSGNSGYFQLTNTSSNSFLPNIINISQSQNDRISQISTKYRTLSYSASVRDFSTGYGAEQFILPSDSMPWQPKENRGLDCAYVESPIAIGDNRIKVGTTQWSNGAVANSTPPRKVVNYSGYGIIENEIIYWGAREYSFSPSISGFNSIESITSPENLMDRVAARIGAQNVAPITSASANSSTGTVTITASNNFAAGDIVFISVPYLFNKFVKLSTASTNAFTFKDTNLANYLIPCNGLASKSIYHVSYTPTGWITNVQRGLFGTNAAAHHYKSSISQSSFFVGMGTNMKLGGTIPLESVTNRMLLSSPKGVNSNYFGFYQKDNNAYNHYQTSFIPTNSKDNFGIFIGATMTSSSGSVSFTTNPATNLSDGMFIEFGTKANGFTGAIWHGSPLAGKKAYIINDFMIEPTPTNHPGTPLRDKSGKVIKGKWKVKPYTTYSQYHLVDVYIDSKNKKIVIMVNGKKVKLKNPANGKITDWISISSLSRTNNTFGVFSRNPVTNSTVYLYSLDATCPNQLPGGDEDARNTLEPRNSLNYLLSEYGAPEQIVRPFSLNTKPLLRGISIFDIKFNGNNPYYDYKIIEPSGLVGFYVESPEEYQFSVLTGTPFRAKLAVRNRSNKLLFPIGNTDAHTSLSISGKTIKTGEEKVFTTKVSVMPGLQQIEINAPWCANESAAENINMDISKNLDAMNAIYSVECFGNPALEPGDYIFMTHSYKNISNYFSVSSINHSFGDGGMTTNLKLRSLNISA